MTDKEKFEQLAFAVKSFLNHVVFPEWSQSDERKQKLLKLLEELKK